MKHKKFVQLFPHFQSVGRATCPLFAAGHVLFLLALFVKHLLFIIETWKRMVMVVLLVPEKLL